MGFLTGDTKGEVNRKTKNQMVNIFLPTTPNPTSGFLLFLPKILHNFPIEEVFNGELQAS